MITSGDPVGISKLRSRPTQSRQKVEPPGIWRTFQKNLCKGRSLGFAALELVEPQDAVAASVECNVQVRQRAIVQKIHWNELLVLRVGVAFLKKNILWLTILDLSFTCV